MKKSNYLSYLNEHHNKVPNEIYLSLKPNKRYMKPTMNKTTKAKVK